MKQFQGIWLPDHEVHLVEHMKKTGERADGKPAYQLKKIKAALAWVKQYRTAIDVGGHCGLWSMHLVKQFAMVHAFEPVADHRACYAKNVAGDNHALHACALGDHEGSVAIHTTKSSSGDSWVKEEAPYGAHEIPLQTLDHFAIRDVDFIKLDCEGYELFALKGGEHMLIECRPCVIVEQKPGRAQKFGLREREAVEYLQGLGAVLRQEISGDFILSWDEEATLQSAPAETFRVSASAGGPVMEITSTETESEPIKAPAPFEDGIEAPPPSMDEEEAA